MEYDTVSLNAHRDPSAHRNWCGAFAILVSSMVASCAPADSVDVVTWIESDSVGVRIVAHTALPESLMEGWVVAAEPRLSIGRFDGSPEYQLFRVSGGTVLDDGRVAVMNAGTREIRVFDGRGGFLATFGSEGEGPGEFMNPTLLGRIAEDSLVVFDTGLRRASLVDVETGAMRSFTVAPEGVAFPVPQGVDANGSIVFGGGMAFNSDGGFPTGRVRLPAAWVSVDRLGELRASLGEHLSFEMWAQAGPAGFSARTLPFGRNTVGSTGDGEVCLGSSDHYEIMCKETNSGTMVRIIRVDRAARTVTQRDRDAYVESELEDADTENQRRDFMALMAEMPVPATMPAYGAMVHDEAQNLWVMDYAPLGQHSERTWTVFDPSGRAIGRVVTPAGARVLEVGADYVLTLTRDEMDVESVQVYQLDRPRA